MEDEDPRDNEKQTDANDFVPVEKKIKKGEKEVTENQSHAYPKPTGPFAGVGIDFTNGIPKGFLGYVGAVDKKILREADVCPKDGKSERETGQIVLVCLFVYSLETAFR